jgi:hypothetical protein
VVVTGFDFGFLLCEGDLPFYVFMLLCVVVFPGVRFSVGKVFSEVLVFRVLLKRGAIIGLSCADPGVSVYESRCSCGTKSEIVETFPFLLLGSWFSLFTAFSFLLYSVVLC